MTRFTKYAGVFLSAALITAGSGIVWRPIVIDPKSKPTTENGLPECGHSWEGYAADSALARFSKEIRDVPEFHDCQRLIVNADGNDPTYGPLAAVFARYRLDQVSFAALPDSLKDTPLENLVNRSSGTDHEPRTFDVAVAVPLALLYFPEGEPPAGFLEAKSQLSCIYVAPVAGFAWVVPADLDADVPCDTISLSELNSNPRLVVRRTYVSQGDGQEIPAVARWDVTSDRRTPVIGIRCGTAWCEIGTAEFTPTTSYAAAGSDAKRFAVKGWYDEQQLAVFPPLRGPERFANISGKLTRGRNIRPGVNIGTVVPTPELEEWKAIDERNGEWIPVARIFMRPDAGPYANELGFVGSSASPPEAPYATLSICRGTATSCRPGIFRRFRASACGLADNPVAYYARVDTPGEAPRYLCVKYRYHGELAIHPPVVRWRWREDDETIWVRCPEGCCEGAAE